MATSFLKRQPPLEEGHIMADQKLNEVRKKAHTLCKQYLGGPWAQITENQFQLMVLGGGLTNKLFICQLPDSFPYDEDVPRIVLLRMYGLIIQDFVAQIQESVVFSILSERRIGPHLYAVFPGGRLEEYLPCRTLCTQDLSISSTSRHIAKQMAVYHNLVMPVIKEPTCIMDKLQWYFDATKRMEFDEKSKSILLENLKSYDLDRELCYIKKLVKESGSPIVFCHNDVQEGNLLHVENETDPVQMIDFEYSGYNYRGFDLGNHFCEWVYNYSHSEWPFYSANLENYPNREQQANFVTSYLEQHFISCCTTSRNDEKWQLDYVIREANRFALLSHFFWSLWSVVQAKMSDISFGYMEYAIERMDAYFKQKAEIESAEKITS